LDVGCGVAVHGDVNLDLFSGECYQDVIKSNPPKSRAKNPVMASAEWLPFRANVFSEAVSYEVLEHVGSPVQMIRDMMRCSHRIRLTTPNAMFINRVFRSWVRGTYTPYKGHINVWGKPELRNLLRHCNLKDVVISYGDHIPAHRYHYPLIYKILMLLTPTTLKCRTLFATGKTRR